MAELLAYLARELVDDPEAVRVETEERDGTLVLVLHVAADDIGKVIGRQGRIARALRTLVRASAAREGRRVLVEIADPDPRMKVAALYDIHGMPWALEAVLARGRARMRSSSAATTSTARARVRPLRSSARSTQTCCAATARTSPRSGNAASSRREISTGCSRCRSR